MNTNLLTCVSRTIHKTGFQLKKHSPEILIAAGVIGTVTSAVLACRATTKLSGILEESKENINGIHNYVEVEGYSERYTEDDCKKDLTIVYVQTGVKIAKLYAPAVILGALSLTAIITSNNILRKRNVAIATAYAAISNNFKEYRDRVVERFGKDLDRELRYNIKAKEIEETTVDPETGNETTVKKTVQVADFKCSPYARFFDESSPYWNKDADLNRTFLIQQQNYANDLLKIKGVMSLNDIYEMIGLPRTADGQVVGWVYDKKNPNCDNYIDFGLYDQVGIERYDERKRSFINGYERCVLLDFNVDSNILQYL